MNELNASDLPDSEDDLEARKRVRRILKEIYNHREKVTPEQCKSELKKLINENVVREPGIDSETGKRIRRFLEDIYNHGDKFTPEQCKSELTKLLNEGLSKKKNKKSHRASGSGDTASLAPGRISVSRGDSAEVSTSHDQQGSLKSCLMGTMKKKLSSDFSKAHKKFEKLVLQSKSTRSDSGKKLKSKLVISGTRRKHEDIEEISTESESEPSLSEVTDSDSTTADDFKETFPEMKTGLPSEEELTDSKESEAHLKTAATGGKEKKKKGATGRAALPNSKLSSELESADEKMIDKLKAKLNTPSSKGLNFSSAAGLSSPGKKETLRKVKPARQSPGKEKPKKI